jgi:glycosyltransferase involved in cell wall biosynthesis
LNIRRRPLSLLIGVARAHRFLRHFRPHLLHSHSFHANFVARLLTALAPKHALICTIHNVYEGGWRRMTIYRLSDGLCSCTTAVSRAAALRFIRLKAVPRRKCFVLSNGIETAEFVPSAERRVQIRSQMTWARRGAKREFIWLAVGRIAPAKDFSNLLRAFARVCAERPDARLWIAGEAAGQEFDRVSSLAMELGPGDRVRWLGLRRDLPALLDAADAFVLSSAWEGMPLAVGEAMAMEKPVVATDVGGVRELVGEAGMIVRAKSPEELARAMLETMQRPAEERRALGLAARERIIKSFSMEAKADEWEALYGSILKRHHSEPV